MFIIQSSKKIVHLIYETQHHVEKIRLVHKEKIDAGGT